jgi:hypothetical protein
MSKPTYLHVRGIRNKNPEPLTDITWQISNVSDAQLEDWANNLGIVERERELCAALLAKRKLEREERRAELEANPFDPRTEVSADAKNIVKHLWFIFVLLPVVLTLLYIMFTAK